MQSQNMCLTQWTHLSFPSKWFAFHLVPFSDTVKGKKKPNKRVDSNGCTKTKRVYKAINFGFPRMVFGLISVPGFIYYQMPSYYSRYTQIQ